MKNEQHFPLADTIRISADVDARDVLARWIESDDIVVYGNGVDAVLDAGELFITASRERQFNKERVEIVLPAQSALGFALKVEHGDVRLEEPHGKLDLRIDSGDTQISGGSGSLTISSGKGDLKINDFAGDVTSNSGSGDKLFTDVTGDIVSRSGRGELKLLRGSGAAEIAGASGDVTISDRITTRLKFSSASGDVTLRGGQLGQSTIETASGDIACHAALTIASYDFTAASGDMTLSIQRDLPLRVDAATTRGSIDSDLPLVAVQQRGPRNPHGKRVVGSTSDAGERAEITLRTASGDIEVQWSNDPIAPTPPVRPMQPEPPIAMPPSTPVTEPVTTSASGEHDLFDDDRKRVILNALADGSLSVEEASRLLDAMRATASGGR